MHPQSQFHQILKKPIECKPDFDTEKLAQKEKKLRKYFVAPEANWGPKPRATGASVPVAKKAKAEEKKE